MSSWGLIQVVFDIFAALGFFIIIMRMSRAPKDDPRLSRGLQLLQSKISVLEDLSDRTESQVAQMTSLLDQKIKEVQAKVQLAEQHVQAIRVSMDNSLEVAKIFQDKIPHQEIIERQNTIKYVQAARLAHQGLSAEEIAKQVDLPKGEIEFISKVNREQLVYKEEQLPAWAREAGELDQKAQMVSAPEPVLAMPASSAPSLGHLSFSDTSHQDQQARMRVEMEIAERQRLVESLQRLQGEMHDLDEKLVRESSRRDLSAAFDTPQVETASLSKLGEEFRRACEAMDEQNAKGNSMLPPLEHLSSLLPQVFQGLGNEAPAPAPQAPPPPPAISQSEFQQSLAASPARPQAPRPGSVQTLSMAESVYVPQQPKQEPTGDPALRRAAAQAKVQAALNRGRANQAAAAGANSDLNAARAMARQPLQQQPMQQQYAPQPQQPVAAQPVQIANTRVSGAKPTATQVRRVQFPRIDSEKG